MSEDKKPKITIAWGSDLELTRTYVFENQMLIDIRLTNLHKYFLSLSFYWFKCYFNI